MPTGAYDTHYYVTMKKLILLLSVILCSLAASAQVPQVAVLNHEGTSSAFYTDQGLIDAYKAAVDGDQIILSSGTFYSPSLTKRVSIRGAGMVNGQNPTILRAKNSNSITLNQVESENDYIVTYEGLYFSTRLTYSSSQTAYLYNTNFIKCHISSLSCPKTKNVKFLISQIDEICLNCYGSDVYLDAYSTFINSVICKIKGGTKSQTYFQNCYIDNSNIFNSPNPVKGTFKNCIFKDGVDTEILSSGYCSASYCYYIGEFSSFFEYQNSPTNHVFVNVDPFKPDTFYELKDEYAADWLGEDGTQVGIYGGSLPFDPTLANPKITKFNVSGKTTADGKLSVDIEVKAE